MSPTNNSIYWSIVLLKVFPPPHQKSMISRQVLLNNVITTNILFSVEFIIDHTLYPTNKNFGLWVIRLKSEPNDYKNCQTSLKWLKNLDIFGKIYFCLWMCKLVVISTAHLQSFFLLVIGYLEFELIYIQLNEFSLSKYTKRRVKLLSYNIIHINVFTCNFVHVHLYLIL